MTTLKELRAAQKNLDHARHITEFLGKHLRELLSRTCLEVLVEGITPPFPRRYLTGVKWDPKAICNPVERASVREGSSELRLLCFSNAYLDVGLLLVNRLRPLGSVTPGVTFEIFPHASVQIASSCSAKSEHLAALVREHKLRGVIAGIQHTEQQGHGLAYHDEPALLGLIDIEGEHCLHHLNESQRKTRQIDWSFLPFLTLNPNH